MTLSEDIKAAFPLGDEFTLDGHELRKVGSRFVCLCPFHQEKTPSCYVSPNSARFHCFGCGADGTVIDFHSRRRGISVAEAIAELTLRLRLPQSNGDGDRVKPPARILKQRAAPRGLPKLPDLQLGNVADLRLLAKSRNISLEALHLASSRGLLWFSEMPDGPTFIRSWIITDRTRKNAQARRLDGKSWQHEWNAEAKHWELVEDDRRRRKVRGFTNNWASWPVGLEEAQPFESIAIVEGVDLLAAFHFLIAENREEKVGAVAILGASNRIPAEVVAMFTGKRVRIFPHVDLNNAGLHASAKWETQLRPVAASVDAFDFTGLLKIDGSPVKDLNNLTSVDADCFESEPDLRSMMDF